MRIIKKILFVVFLVLFALTPFVIPRFLRVNKIVCQSQYGRCNKVIESKLKVLESRDLSYVKRVVKSTLENEILIRSFNTQFKLPDSIEINILERKPKYALTTKEKKLFAYVDKEGKVLSLTETSDLPVLIEDSLPDRGNSVTSQELFALQIMYDIYTTFQVKEGTLDTESLVIEFPYEMTVIFPLEGDRQVLTGTAVLLLSELEKEEFSTLSKLGKNIDTIDLRYKNPVLR